MPEFLRSGLLINTSLQRGVTRDGAVENRFNGLTRMAETVETVLILVRSLFTLLKRGVNESGFQDTAHQTVFKLQHFND